MRAPRSVVLMLSCLMLTACAGQNVRPVTEIRNRPLDAGVDPEMILELVQFAAKDRICAAKEQHARRSEGRIAGYSKWQPIPASGHDPYATYISCMYAERVTVCDAVQQDLQTVHTLLDQDPRLAAIASFDELRVRLQQQCPAAQQPAMSARSLRSWSHRALQRCEDRYQPVLITTAILLRTLPPQDEEAAFLWSAGCRGTAGYYFMDVHCYRFLSPRPPPGFEIAARFEQGVEAYFCQQIKNHFG